MEAGGNSQQQEVINVVGARPRGRFSAVDRVRKASEFRVIQRTGRRVTTTHFVLILYARDEQAESTPPRLGIVASRKVGNAVHRNRAKRLVREAFRATRQQLDTGVDLVVIVRRPLAELKLADVIGEWHGQASAVRRQLAKAQRDRVARAAGAEKGPKC